MIVTSEFDRWQTAAGDPKKDRLDILGIDETGQLVLAELKRGQASSHVDLQALKYAALVSRFDKDSLIDAHRRFLNSRGSQPVSIEDAAARLESHVEGPLDPDLWQIPRIVLFAHGFDQNITNTVVWLSETGLDISLLRYQLYRTDGDPVFVVSQMYPTPETEEFILAPKREEVKQAKAEAKSERRQRTSVKILAAEKALSEGTPLHMEPFGVNEELKERFMAWLNEDQARAEGTWTGDPTEPIVWAYDGSRGKPSTLANRAFAEATGVNRALNGAQWWVTHDGTSLADLAAQHVEAKKATRDWSDLHALLSQLPEDRWTTYGDVAQVIGTAPQPLGQHLATCDQCEHAYQVLTNTGAPSENFAWTDPTETRTPQEVLQAQGVNFDDGIANPSQRLTLQELQALRET